MQTDTKTGFRFALLVLTLALTLTAQQTSAQTDPGTVINPQAVEEVRSGKRTIANVAWWGFDSQDATRSLQAAIDSGARTVVVPYMGAEWIVTPIRLRSNQEVIFEPGVVVLAKKGGFKGRGECLFTATECEDLTLRGYGATFRMRKKDYAGAPYVKAEWRHTISLRGCRGVKILGLRLESSGGDGIYVGATKSRPYCEDVVIDDVVCDDHYRQGISVIGAVNLLIDHCTMTNTEGTGPAAGIDFEPNHATNKLVNCAVRHCLFENNANAGILMYLANLTGDSDPISVTFDRCYVKSGQREGIAVLALSDRGPQGMIEFRNCTIENTVRHGLLVYNKSSDAAKVQLTNCRWKNVGIAEQGGKMTNMDAPLVIGVEPSKGVKKPGGIEFVNCRLYDNINRPCIRFNHGDGEAALHGVKGSIIAHNPKGVSMLLGPKTKDVDLNVAGPRN